MGHRSWFTNLESKNEYNDFIHAIQKPNMAMFSYSDIVYFLKVNKDIPFKKGAIVAAWSSNSDLTIKKLPFYLRQQTELLDAVFKKYPDLQKKDNWMEEVGDVFSPEMDNSEEAKLLSDLPKFKIEEGIEKTEYSFIEKLYYSKFTDPSMLAGLNMKVFLSHSHNDKPFVHKLAKSLTAFGINSWIDEAEIKFGESLIWKIATAIDDLDFIIAIVSNSSIESNWVKKELSMAMSLEISQGSFKVIPIRIDDCKMPIFLQDKLYADFRETGNYEKNLRKLAYSMDLGGFKMRDMLREILPDEEIRINTIVTEEELKKKNKK